MDLTMESIDTNKKVSLTLTMALPMALPMTLHTVLPMNLPMDLPLVSSLVTDASDKFCSTLESSLMTDDTNIYLPLHLLPYPNISMSFHFYCITDIDFTYHLLLHHK